MLVRTADTGRVPHAALFTGRMGYGTLALALAWAQYVNCEHKVHYGEDGEILGDSCGECPSCKAFEALSHPDLHFIFPTTTTEASEGAARGEMGREFRQWLLDSGCYGNYDDWMVALGSEKKKGIIRVKDAQEMIRQLSLKSYSGNWKTVVMWMPETMNADAANELLKTLEEPSEGSLLMLVGEQSENLLSTVKSRCQRVNVPQIEVKDMLIHGVEESQARKAEGDWRMVRKLQEGSQEETEMGELFVSWMRKLFKLNMLPLSEWVDEVYGWQNREKQRRFLQFAQESFRACFLSNVGGMDMDYRLSFGDEKFDRSFPTMVTENNIEDIMGILREAEQSIGQNCHAKIVMMRTSFRLSSALKKR